MSVEQRASLVEVKVTGTRPRQGSRKADNILPYTSSYQQSNSWTSWKHMFEALRRNGIDLL